MATAKPDLTRVWASTAPGSNVVDPDTTTPGKFNQGWLAEVPPFEHFNFLQQLFTKGLAHNNEQGVNLWDANTTYPVNGIAKGSNGVLYKAKLEQDGNDPTLDDGTNWLPFISTTLGSDIQALKSQSHVGYNQSRSIAFHPGWAASNEPPKGGATYYDDGTTGTPSTVYGAGDSNGHVENTGYYAPDGRGFTLCKYCGNRVNVYQTGAYGTGLIADADAFQFAIDFLDSGGVVDTLNGVFLFDKEVAVASWYGAPAIEINGAGTGPWNKDGGIAVAGDATQIKATADGFNLFRIASTSQTTVKGISFLDEAVSRTSGAAIYIERDGGGVVGDDGNVTGVTLSQFSIKGFYDGIQAVRLLSSVIEQFYIEDSIRDGIRLESTGAGAGTSLSVKNGFVKECGQDNYSAYGMSYTTFENTASDFAGRHNYYLDGVTRNNTSIVFKACGSENATVNGIHITAGNIGVVIEGCALGPSGGDNLYSEAANIVIIGGLNQQAGGYGINVVTGSGATIIGTDFSSNATADIFPNPKVILLNADSSYKMLLGHTVTTGSNDSEIVLRNSAGLCSVNAAGTTALNYKIRGSGANDWIYGVPDATANHYFQFAGVNRLQIEEENGGACIRFLGVVSSHPAAPAAGQMRTYLLDNGGKTEYYARFATGAPVLIVAEP